MYGVLYKDDTFEQWSVDAFLEQGDANEYLIDGVLPKESHAMIYAPTGHMKSFMAIHLAGCVSTGTPFNNQAVEQGEVVYIAAEAPREIAKRMRAWRTLNGFGDEEIISFFPTTVKFKEPESVARLRRYLEVRKGAVKLVIFDTAARCASGIDEDNNSQVNELVNEQLTELITDFGLSVLVVHHTGKDGITPRGASAWIDACDTYARVETIFQNKSRRENPLMTTLVTEKLRGDHPISVAFRPVKHDGTLVLTDATLEDAQALKPKAGRPRKDSTDRKDGTPRQRGSNKMKTPDRILVCLAEGVTTPEAMSVTTGIAVKTIKNNLTTLRSQNVVDSNDGSWFLLDKAS